MGLALGVVLVVLSWSCSDVYVVFSMSTALLVVSIELWPGGALDGATARPTFFLSWAGFSPVSTPIVLLCDLLLSIAWSLLLKRFEM